jgi:hypothetical protein
VVAEIGEGEHETCTASAQDRLDSALHEFEDVREAARLEEPSGEVHEVNNTPVRDKGFRPVTRGPTGRD